MKWIKVDCEIHRRREVKLLCKKMGVKPDHMVGTLVRFWAWADGETENGMLESITRDIIDDEVGFDGFASALEGVGWLLVADDGCILPNFEKHNGQSAKRRASDQRRKAHARKQSNGKV